VSPETIRSFEVSDEEAGERLDVFLARHDPGHSRSYYGRLLEEGRVEVDERTRKASHRLRPGEKVVVRHRAPEPSPLEPEDIPLSVIYEDESLLVIDKPPGMVVHPGAGNRRGTLVHALLARGGGLSPGSAVERPGIVHRLDKGTSGLIVVARDEQSHLALAEQFSQRRVIKEYQALVWGDPVPPQGEIRAHVGRHPRHRKKMAVLESGGREAVTRYRVLDLYERMGYICVRLETGRTHQIRVHLAHRGWPVVGDPLYGGRRSDGGRSSQVVRRILGILDRPALHASFLRLTHPLTRNSLEFEAPLPPDFSEALRVLGGTRHTGRCFP
jgi:23S rRNA pseudouridine1911/1915/1917 synthase